MIIATKRFGVAEYERRHVGQVDRDLERAPDAANIGQVGDQLDVGALTRQHAGESGEVRPDHAVDRRGLADPELASWRDPLRHARPVAALMADDGHDERFGEGGEAFVIALEQVDRWLLADRPPRRDSVGHQLVDALARPRGRVTARKSSGVELHDSRGPVDPRREIVEVHRVLLLRPRLAVHVEKVGALDDMAQRRFAFGHNQCVDRARRAGREQRLPGVRRGVGGQDRAHSAASSRLVAALRSTETRRLTPCSIIVTPYNLSMRLIVTALWVTIR